MTVTKTLYSSESIIWETPITLFNKLNARFNFTLDVCALEENAKCEKFFSPEDDGLAQDWSGSCWMNPPYGKTINLWMKKAYEESQRPEVEYVVCLVPSRTDTRWWADYAMNAAEIIFVKGRLKFGGSKNSAPFPSAIIVFNKHNVSPIIKSM